ncbi:hypothetical protein GW764_04100 [Candidatus Parcubacteria bacterium]|nr:hypothetical protein [Candidatus Parcubacteria bacterium]
MSDFKFEEETGLPHKKPSFKKESGMVKWLRSKGIAKSEKTAQGILILIIVVCFGIAWVLLADTFGGSSNSQPQQQLTEEEILQLPEDNFRRIQYERNNQ